jgi:glycosyltransferase involved in cell wall biosynthesis
MNDPALTIIMPALNEEENVQDALRNTLAAFDEYQIAGEIIVVDDGSKDRTGEIVAGEIARDPRIQMVRHETPEGIGAAFWEGVKNARGQAVCMLPGDNENDPWELFRYYRLLEQVDAVVPFVFNKQVRSIFRNVLSYVYRTIINTTFMVSFNYTNGTVLYRKVVLDELKFHSKGFFFQTDILVRIVRHGYLFAEVPYRLNLRSHGVSKAVTFPSFVKVARGYLRLVRDIHLTSEGDRMTTFATASQTARRYADPSPMRHV